MMRAITLKTLLYILPFSVILSLAACAPPANKLYTQGQAAYQQQNFHTAFNLLYASAKGGNLQAQYAVGYMYYYGIGVQRDPIQAVKWFKKSAKFGNVNAINALDSIQQGAPKTLPGVKHP